MPVLLKNERTEDSAGGVSEPLKTMTKRKYAAVGTGGRVPMFIDPLVDKYREHSELVGLCDPSEVRRTYHQRRLAREYGCGDVPVFADFDLMLREQKPDVVMVCTPDYLHHHYIIRALESGSDVISEKPITTDVPKCREILSAVERTGRRLRTAFNYRWMPGPSKVRELVAGGEIGTVRHVNFEYLLNTAHGADYFRRWHSQKEFSGGLLVHKATHHFDLINWWIDGIASQVFAIGDLVFYGRANAVARGQAGWTEYGRYTGVPEAAEDPFRLLLDEDPAMRELYLRAEAETGYLRDQNVFRDGITIEDSMSLVIKYRTGAMVNYSLNAFCPYEGFRVTLTGDAGRLEYSETHATHIITGDKKVRVVEDDGSSCVLRLQKLFSEPVIVPIAQADGDHGGADPLIQEQMFAPDPPPDPLCRSAGHEQGVASVMIGAAGNLSIATGLPVDLAQILPLRPEARHLSELV